MRKEQIFFFLLISNEKGTDKGEFHILDITYIYIDFCVPIFYQSKILKIWVPIFYKSKIPKTFVPIYKPNKHLHPEIYPRDLGFYVLDLRFGFGGMMRLLQSNTG